MSLDDLSNKIEQKLDFLFTSLENLKAQQKSLDENSERLKSFIHSSSDKEINLLEQRESQLIRQVEVVTSCQRTALDSQIAKLLHIKGSLSATQEILHQCHKEDFDALTRLFERLVARLKPIENLKLMSVHFDSQALESVISSFGKVQLPDLSMNEDACSSIFPSSMEEYGDSDHDILHKSIGICCGLECDGEEPAIVKVQFPKIPDSEWLAKSSHKTCHSAIANMKSDISSWLADLHVSQTSEEKKSDSSFELVDCEDPVEQTSNLHVRKEKSRRSSIGSSIEIVSQISSEKDCFSHVCNSNLSDNKNCWLSLGRSMTSDCKETDQEVPLSMDMEELACQANEPCKNYDECVCDGYCKEIAKERALQTSKWLLKSGSENKVEEILQEEVLTRHQTGLKRKLGVSEGGREVLKHMKFILNSDKHRWLSSNSLSLHLEGKVDAIEDAILYKNRSHSWLSRTTTSECRDTPSLVKYSPHSNIWLLHKMKEARKTLQDQKNKAQQATENSPHNTILVSDLKGALDELSVILPKYSPNFGANSISNASAHSIHASAHSKFSPHNNSQVSDRNLEHARKLQWLFQSESKHPVTPNSNLSKMHLNSLPASLVELAEKDLNKWLMDRL